MSEITYQREQFDPSIPMIKALNDAHGVELTGRSTDLNTYQYQVLQREGRHIFITAKDGDKYVGYASHFWHRHLHYNIRIAQDDAWYVMPEYRKQGIGRKLRELSIEELKKDNVQLVMGRLKAAHPHDDSLTNLGYMPYETVWLLDLMSKSGE